MAEKKEVGKSVFFVHKRNGHVSTVSEKIATIWEKRGEGSIHVDRGQALTEKERVLSDIEESKKK